MKEQIGVMLSSSEVENRISEMAAAIDKAYEGKTIHLILPLTSLRPTQSGIP